MRHARPYRSRGQVARGLMNKTEMAYASRLEAMKVAGKIIRWAFEPINFRLAPKCFYRPDFLVVTPYYLEVHEVKGFWRDDALVKFKVAADEYPEFRWCWVSKVKGLWEVHYVD